MNNLGAAGEKRAEEFLKTKGFKILERNFSRPFGEIDIIAIKRRLLVFVEVKARAYAAFGGPAAAVTPAKQKRITLAASAWLKQTKIKFDGVRFDVIAITDTEIEHIENAFIPARMSI